MLKIDFSSMEIYSSIEFALPEDHSRTAELDTELYPLLKKKTGKKNVLDLGCGAGLSEKMFNSLDAEACWYGVDLVDSPEVRLRHGKRDTIRSFDGVHLPYQDCFFDIVYTKQVLEHVRYPDALLAEVARVLKDDGILVGSVSYLEPYHSYSIFNFTPYGLLRVMEDAGLTLISLRPQKDALGLLIRQLVNRSTLLKFLWQPNYLYAVLGLLGKIFRFEHKKRNFLKIQFSGHLVFIVVKDKGML